MKRFVFLLMFVLVSASVLADISISEPSDVYNLGDRLYIDLDGLRGTENGNLDIDLVCGNASVNLVRIPARAFSAEEDQTYSVPYKVLDREDLGVLNLDQIVGICQIVVSLGGDVASSKSFEVSDKIVVVASVDADSYNPGDAVSVKIEAVKSNGAVVNGFAEGFNSSVFNKAIEDGVAEEVFYVPETSEAGIYRLSVRVYDVGLGGILNEGIGSVSYVVNQVATSLVLSLSDVVATPGEDFSIGVEVFDQAGVGMMGNVFIRVISPDGSEIESIVPAGEFALIEFESNSSVGTWKIISQFDDMVQEREFEMAALQKVEFEFEESVLVVENVGNVLYNKSIDVNIGEEIMELDLKIEVGEIRKFSLEAPIGEYDVVVGDGDYEVNHRVLLTGNAVSVSDFRTVGIFKSYSIVWIFLIIVLGGVGGVLFMRYRKTRTLGEDRNILRKMIDKVKVGGRASVVGGRVLKKKVGDKMPAGVKSHMDSSLNFTKKSPAVQGLDVKNYSASDKSMVDFTKKGEIQAESALVMKGEKHMSAVVALSIKNYGNLGEVAREGLREIVEGAKGKGLVDYRSDYIFVVFSPLVTRTYSNEALAVRTGMKIVEDLIGYNKKFRDKLEFGVGVHAGDLIASKDKGKLKYTGIGNTISFAKRMSDIDEEKVVVSEIVRKKLIRDLKVEKGKEIGEKMTFVVGEMKDRGGDAARLKDLLKRQG